jgi:O-acetylserine/cysteine efflux transporter
MSASHLLLALAVVFVWGTNFVVIKLGLNELPPLLFATLRFASSALPWLFFIKRPAVGWSSLAAFGTFLGVGQFGLLFLAMRADISPGLASLVIQAQVFFTVGLSVWLLGERIHWWHLAGLAIAVTGIVVIGAHVDQTTTLKGLAMVLLSALCWAAANLTVKRAAKAHGTFNMLGFMIWSSLFAVPPLALLSLAFEQPATVRIALSNAGLTAWVAVLWQAVGNTLFGYGIWNWLLARHPAATVAPLALLVPVFGFGASSIVLGEPLQAWKILAALLVISGLAVSLFGNAWSLRGPRGLSGRAALQTRN